MLMASPGHQSHLDFVGPLYHCFMQQIEPIATVVIIYGTTLSVLSNCPFSLLITRSTAFDATWSSEIHQRIPFSAFNAATILLKP